MAGDSGCVAHAGMPAGNLVELAHHCRRPLRRRRIGKLHGDHQVAHVLRGNKAARRGDEPAVSQSEQAGVHNQGDARHAQERTDSARVAMRGALEAAIERSKRDAEDVVEWPADDPSRRAAGEHRRQRRQPHGLRRQGIPPLQPFFEYVAGEQKAEQPADDGDAQPRQRRRRLLAARPQQQCRQRRAQRQRVERRDDRRHRNRERELPEE